MIQLNEELKYDDSLAFEDQTDEVKSFVSSLMGSIPTEVVTEPAGKVPRATKKVWAFDNYKVIVKYSYVNPAEHCQNGLIANETIEVQNVVDC